MSSDEESLDLTPANITEEAQKANESTLPPKSRDKYLEEYEHFLQWKTEKNCSSFSENVILAYFSELAAKYKPTTLWSKYSMLKSTIRCKNDINIQEYHKLIAFLKRQSDGFRSKKSKVLSASDVEKFLNEAPDKTSGSLKTHQEKKLISNNRDDITEETNQNEIQPGNQYVETAINVNEPRIKPATEDIIQNINETNQIFDYQHQHQGEADVNVTEILIASKRNLELQVCELQARLAQLQDNYKLATNNNILTKKQISNLEYELKSLHERYLKASEENTKKEKIISELNNAKSALCDENNNLLEQLEFTKSMLTAKESESTALNNQVINLQAQLDSMHLHLQQITSGAQGILASHSKNDNPDQNPEVLQQKISYLEQQLKSMKKEKDQLNSHYDQFLGELNEQLKLTTSKNNELQLKVENLSIRENSLVEQISEMEIRLQNMKQQQQPLERHEVVNQDMKAKHEAELNALQQKYENIQEQMQAIYKKYDDLQLKYTESKAKVEALSQAKETECEHDNISISKLTADIASDKLAAQRATEQNRKLKVDLQELEEAFVKISKDKLELTEKVAAEKFLNRELTIKLADSEERAKNLQIKLKAKDEEMIRLQNSYRELERKLEKIPVHKSNDSEELSGTNEQMTQNDKSHVHNNCTHQIEETEPEIYQHSHDMVKECNCVIENEGVDNNSKIPNQDAMVKLQDRFLKIMDEVANLSDEKHRLEHIILQLQNETDTICEYVALYQQQRSLLKKRDEERSAQIKIFQAECELLKSQLEELSGIIIRLAQDTELAVYFQTEPRHGDLAKVMKLLTNLKSNTLIDPHKSSDLKNFYPCSCCSGQLIEV